MELLDALDAATAEFRRRLVDVTDDQWSDPTPCDGWDVRYLVAHVVGGNRFGAMVLAGSTAEQAIGSVMTATMLGSRPLDDYDSSIAEQRRGFRRPGALADVCDHPAGATTGAQFLALRVFDLSVHAWDLARAIGGDEQLDVELCHVVLDVLTALAESGGPGFGMVPVGRTTSSDSTQAQVLDLSGRQP
jgi:uncharacterized protein (TIGR03086 family)